MVSPARAPLRTDRLRAVNAPRLVTVELNADGVPSKVWRSRDNGGGRKTEAAVNDNGGGRKTEAAVNDNGGGQEETAAVVETVLEMWRIDDEWWRHLISRRYFAVIFEGGTRVVLFENL